MARHWKVYGQHGYPPQRIEQEAVGREDAIDIGVELVRAGVQHVKAEPIYKGDSRRRRVITFTVEGHSETDEERGGIPWSVGARINRR